MDHLEKAKGALFDLDLKKAVDLASYAVSQASAGAEEYLFLAHLQWHFKQDGDASLDTLGRGFHMHVQDPRFPKAKADTLVELGKPAQAISDYIRAIELLELDESRADGGLRDSEEAQSDAFPGGYEAVADPLALLYDILCSIGRCYLQLDREAEAVTCLEKALEHNPMGFGANRLLRRIYLQHGEYREFLHLWKLDHGLLHEGDVVGTIADDASQLQRSIESLVEQPSSAKLFQLGYTLRSLGLHDEALVVWTSPAHKESLSDAILEDIRKTERLLAIMTEYAAASENLYRALMDGERRKPKRHIQMLYAILWKVTPDYEKVAHLPDRYTRKNWERLCRFFERQLRIHIHSFFGDKSVVYGTYVSHWTNERYHLLDPGYNKGRFVYRELARDIDQSFLAWAWQYFNSGPAGWSGQFGYREIYRCTDAYKCVTIEWATLKDTARQKRAEDEIADLLASNRYEVTEVFHCPALVDRIRYRYAEAVADQLSEELRIDGLPGEGAGKLAFFQACYEQSLYTSLCRHEGSYALGPETIGMVIRTQLYGWRRGMRQLGTAAEYRARLSEMIHAQIPVDPLRHILSRDIDSQTTFGLAHRKLIGDMVRHIAEHSHAFAEIDTTRNIMLQLHRLNMDQISKIARAII